MDHAREHAAHVVEQTLRDREIEYRRASDETFVVILPGERKLKTTVSLTLGRHTVRFEGFVCRQPDENHEGVYRFMLRRNRRLYTVAYTLDRVGDIYLVGRLAIASVTPEELDRVLGQILATVDGDFNTLLELGFAESIRREWRWRVSRGEPLTNLRAFAHLIPGDGHPDARIAP